MSRLFLLPILILISFFGFTKNNTILIESYQKQIPVLRNKEVNPVLHIIIRSGKAEKIEKIDLSLNGTTNLNDIKEASLYYTLHDSIFFPDEKISSAQPSGYTLSLNGLQLKKGDNHLWISLRISQDADLLNFVDVQLTGIKFKKESNISYSHKESDSPLRLGLALRDHNDDGVHTYRIPGLTTTTNGTLLAIYDVRRDSSRDLQGDMDIGLSRSTDGGNAWEPMKIAMDMGTWGGLPEKFNGVSDACILSDSKTGDIYLAGLWMYGVINKSGKWLDNLSVKSKEWNHQWRNKGSQPGFDVKETSQFLICKSTDDGLTWSEPVNLTKQCKKEEWWLWAPAPGNGITLKDGTLVFPTQGRDSEGIPFSNITYSKDGGKTWKTSNHASSNTTECAVVQLKDESLMLNIRTNNNRKIKDHRNGRTVCITSNLGETWTKHKTSNCALPEPVCMASLRSHKLVAKEGKQTQILLFSNPYSKFKRNNITIKASLDNGNTWPEDYHILLDEGTGRGYSCITSIDNNTIGIIYESSRADMVFQKISIEELNIFNSLPGTK
jgi:sialidase-1